MLVPKVLIVTGFHRSATSAVANYLLNAGLDMGADLMAATVNNAKGHFEDWDAVQLHDQFLANSGTNWQFHNECSLYTDTQKLQGYIKKRSSHSAFWGVKDPRACLFLNDWHSALQEKGHFLFTVRHWSSCIESLLHRESKDLAHLLPTLKADSVGLKFWTNPELAAQMWLSYNQRILAFAKQHPGSVLLVTQRALFESAPILSMVNAKFGFTLDTQATSPFESHLLRDQASSRIFDSLSLSLKAALEAVWQDILDLTDEKSQNEAPRCIDSPSIDNQVLAQYQQSLSESVESDLASFQVFKNPSKEWLASLTHLKHQEKIIKALDSSSQQALLGLDMTKFLNLINERFHTNGKILLSVAKLLMRINHPEIALIYLHKAMSANTYFPYMHMLMGLCHQRLLQYDEALLLFDKAIKQEPENPNFYVKKARCLLLLDLVDQAEDNFKVAYTKGSNEVACVLPYCDYLIKSKRLNDALNIAEELVIETQHSAALDMVTRINLNLDYQRGQACYIQNVKTKLQHKDKMQWLVHSCCYIANSASEIDFITRVNNHWDALSDS